MIAQKSEGSMRDALGFLDQVLVYQNSDISKEEIQNILGIVGLLMTKFIVKRETTQNVFLRL